MPAEPDLSEFLGLSQPKKRACPIGAILEGQAPRGGEPALKPEEVAQLEAACATESNVVTSGAISSWLRARGYKIHTNAIVSHRKGTCTCG